MDVQQVKTRALSPERQRAVCPAPPRGLGEEAWARLSSSTLQTQETLL